jgi:hypothetical protein
MELQTKLTVDGVKEGSKNGVKETPAPVDVSLNTSINNSINWHKSHRYLFVFEYSGIQPTRGNNSFARVGRYKTIPQAKFNYNEDKVIIFTLPRTLKVWVKHPSGIKTKEQLIAARAIAREVVASFARKHGIAIDKEREAGFSEHTIEAKPLDRVIRPVVAQEPELAKERLGLSLNLTSHKNKIEWTGKTAKERVLTLEHILDRDDLATKGDLAETMQAVKELTGALRELIGASTRPPERPGKETF